MKFVAIKMLVGDRARYLGILMGLTFASLLITQQAAIFEGLMHRTFGFITDTGGPDIWVMDKKVLMIEDIKPLQETMLYRVRGVEGVDWAMPLYKGLLKARLENGGFQTCHVIGLDDATLVGGPGTMIEGRLEDLRRADSVILDIVGAEGKLARAATEKGGKAVPIKVGDTLELNDHRAIVVGICRTTRTFQSQPVIYTTYSRATQFAPQERKPLSFVLVKAKDGVDRLELCRKIEAATGLAAYTQKGFQDLTYSYFMKYTGIPINFGIAVLLGFIVGTAIAGQTFFNFTVDNIKYFAALKAMGARDSQLLGMILLQAMIVGAIGWGIGVGAASLFGLLLHDTELSFLLTWQLLTISGFAILVICTLSALISIRTVMRAEPAIVFKG
ncbi:MAG: ABC transporter permease [Planctomycetes bacterium]|nr:ABC transporter permease [Planctomycetota bacterium]